MNDRLPAEYLGMSLLVCLLASGGCRGGRPSDQATTDKVCELAAKQFGVDRSQVKATTSLADLEADELSFVELIMELEEHFDVTIPESAVKEMTGEDWSVGRRNVTMTKLARIIDDQRRSTKPR